MTAETKLRSKRIPDVRKTIKILRKTKRPATAKKQFRLAAVIGCANKKE